MIGGVKMGKHYVIVGGTKGMGRALVDKLAIQGHKVSVLGRSSTESNNNIKFWQLDLLQKDKIESVLDDIINQNGKVDHLVFFQRYRGDGDYWKGEMDVTVTTTKKMVEYLADKFSDGFVRRSLQGQHSAPEQSVFGGGLIAANSIVMVSSLIGNFVASEQGVGYHVAKAGLNQLVRYFAVKLGPQGIRVNSVSPCAIQKKESKEYYENNQKVIDLYKKITPLQRMGNSEDLADVIAFLCSPEASFLTGQNIILDGGISLQGHEALARKLIEKKELEEKEEKKEVVEKNIKSEEVNIYTSDAPTNSVEKNETLVHRTTCRLCDSETELVLPLKATPIADRYIPVDVKTDEADKIYPLDLALCNNCGHLQLMDIINPEILYANYSYHSSSSLGLVKHFEQLAQGLIATSGAEPNSLVVDIGSNDGSLLRFFKEKDMRVLGVDPAKDLADKATLDGLQTIPKFFTSPVADEIKTSHGNAKIITANNVFAHADDLSDIVKGVAKLLSSNGIFVFEVSYLVHIVERYLFDTVYHEHLSYHLVKPLQIFFNKHGMELFNVEYVPTKGGSLRGFAQLKEGPQVVSPVVEKFIFKEEAEGYLLPQTYRNFGARIQRIKEELLHLIENIRASGKTIAGFGASHTVTTLLHHFDLGDKLDFIMDDNPQKQNTLSPGHNILVESSEALYTKKPDYVLLLAWQYAEPIMKNNQRYIEEGGKFILPLPSPTILP